ncbi:CRISPR-associated endonuclease Cas2 [bacterium]|nr:CRISPR-associated endonuclease Cas2 [bacterium]
MKRRDYLVTYDISDDKRLRSVFKAMKGYGEHVQFSVFRCSLTKTEMTEMMAKLSGLIHHGLDQVLIIYLGPLPEKRPRVRPLGRPYQPVEPGARVL